MSALQAVALLITAPFAAYLVVRFGSAAYFRSKRESEKHNG